MPHLTRCMDHNILLRHLETSFGIDSYLSGRTQRVTFDGKLSERCHLSFGVPQGSCLGPLIFSVYASKLFEVINTQLCHAHAYADDTQLYLSFKPDSVVGETEAGCAMEQCIRTVRAWMVADKLKINEEKTDIMLIGTHQQLTKVRTDWLLVAGTVVLSVSEARNLGVWFDSKFQFQKY